MWSCSSFSGCSKDASWDLTRYAGQVSSEVLNKERDPYPPGWGLVMGHGADIFTS